MQLAALRRWHWIVIGALVGLLIGIVRDHTEGQLYGLKVPGFGLQLLSQQQFEDGLVRDYQGTRLFSDPVVYPHWTTDSRGRRKQIYVVCGRFWDGQPQMKDGKQVADWEPRCRITDTPYRPHPGFSAVTEYPSVIEFLDALHQKSGVNYRYAWWAVHPVLTWLGVCLVLIGGIWPTVINLIVWGTWSRPPEAKALSLWKVRGAESAPVAAPPVSLAPASDEEEELSLPEPTIEPEIEPAPPVQEAPLEPAPAPAASDRQYGRDKDDFYPTERHVPARKPERP